MLKRGAMMQGERAMVGRRGATLPGERLMARRMTTTPEVKILAGRGTRGHGTQHHLPNTNGNLTKTYLSRHSREVIHIHFTASPSMKHQMGTQGTISCIKAQKHNIHSSKRLQGRGLSS